MSPLYREEGDDAEVLDEEPILSEPLPPQGPRHRNAAGKEFVTVTCLSCQFQHAHPPERLAASPALPRLCVCGRQRASVGGLDYCTGCSQAVCACVIRAASPALDVERLAEAIDAVAVHADPNSGMLVSADHAESIADEYARLTAAVPTSEPNE